MLWVLFQPSGDARLTLGGLGLYMATGGFVAGNVEFSRMLKCSGCNPAAVQTHSKTLF